MVDINLLPEDLRKQEQKEKQAAEKKPPVFEMPMHMPEDQQGGNGLKGKLTTEAPKSEERERLIPLARQREAVFRELEKSEKSARPQAVMPPGGNEFSYLGGGPSNTGEGEIHVLQKVEKPRPVQAPVRPPVSAVAPVVKKLPPQVKEVRLPAPKKKRRSLWEWLRSLFTRRKKIVPPKIILEKPAVIERPITTPFKPLTPPPLVAFKPLAPPGPSAPKSVTAPTQPAPAAPKPPSPAPRFSAPPPLPKSSPVPPVPSIKIQPVPSSRRIDREVETPVQTLEINLIPDSENIGPENSLPRRLLVLALTLFASCLVVGIAYAIVKYYEGEVSREIAQVQQNIDTMRQKIAGYDKDRESVNQLITRLTFVENLVDQHIFWTPVFAKLEEYTVEDVFFTNFAASRGGDISLSAVGQDYTSVARQLVAFQEAHDFIASVQINSATAVTSAHSTGIDILSTDFEVTLRLVPGIFYKKL